MKATEIESNQLLTNYRTKRACLAPAKIMPKTKTKAAPLSKYRRKTANARERTRMREINTAFEQLRHCVPPTIIGEDPNSTNEKLTKITTLRLAMKYIQTLSQALENPTAEMELLQELEMAGDLRFKMTALEFQQQQGEPLKFTMEDEEEPIQLTKKIPKSTQKSKIMPKSKSGQAKAGAAKSTQKKQNAIRKTNANKTHKYKNTDTNSALSPASTSSAYSSQYSNASFSSTASTISETSNTSTVYDHGNVTGIIEMNHLQLESDGESLHLSEHCLSPLSAQHNNNLFSSSTLGNNFTNFDTAMAFSTLENPLELSLRLLDPTVTDQQQPSACISHLSGLDTLPPYCDLLSVDFPEHSTLDMFLT